ncbi:MAG TPA: hypothetical protein VNN80_30430, partial [Polyangiaceae bacterium]|nr:hypothetical protein [Polyangiaceae bacterium]
MNVPPDPPEHRAGETRAGSRAAVWAVLVALLRCSADEPRTDAEERSERAAGGTVVELDPNEAPPAARCVAADCTLASLLPLDAASCCTSSGECGIDLGAGCVTPQFDADCSGDIGFGCCLESLCGTLDMATGACRPPPEVTEAERFRLDVAPELSAPPNRRLDCDGYLVATCGASSCSEGLLGPFACCLPDGSCGLSPDGATCYPGELL